MEREFFEMEIDDSNYERFAISLVTNPAMEDDALMLSKEDTECLMLQDLNVISNVNGSVFLMGAVMIPDKKIPRRRDDGSMYDIIFRKDSIRKAAHIYLADSNQSKWTEQHRYDISNLSTVESWIVEDSEKDKSTIYGKKYEVGTWAVILESKNVDVNKRILNGELKGFSIEAISVFTPKKVELSMQDEDERILAELKELLKNV